MKLLSWLPVYKKEDLTGDTIAGLIVAIMLIPQAMAYALLAGLPPQYGLYASVLPLIIYGLLGSSNYLAVGPVAIISLMVTNGLVGIVPPESSEYIEAAITLSLLSGLVLFIFGLLRFGYFVNYLSRPVISGFINAAVILIALSQLRHLLGMNIPHHEQILSSLVYLTDNVDQINPVTVMITVASIAILFLTRKPFASFLKKIGTPVYLINSITKTGALIAVIFGISVVWIFGLNGTVDIVGVIPKGLSSLSLPSYDEALWQQLLPVAIFIALVGYLESISVVRSLASKKRQKINHDQELLALGTANIGAAMTSGMPVAGGISRSSVNFTAGANTPLASIITAVLIALFITFFVPVLFYLPKAVLSSIILVAVLRLIDLKTLVHTWQYNKPDALAMLVTFFTSLLLNIEMGLIIGVLLSIALYLWRTSVPHIAIVGRDGNTEHYRNIKYHDVQTCPHVVAIRVDESLYFANAHALEEEILNIVAEQDQVKHVVLICSAINFIDASALEALEMLNAQLKNSSVTLHLTEIKEPVMERLKRSDFINLLGEDRIFTSTHQAMVALKCF